MSSAYVIEIGEEAAGIVAAEKRGVRFYSAGRAYDALDGTLFGSPREAEKAVRIHRSKSRPATPRAAAPKHPSI